MFKLNGKKKNHLMLKNFAYLDTRTLKKNVLH